MKSLLSNILAALLLMAVFPAALGATPVREAAGHWLRDEEIRYVFIGREVKGKYKNGAPFSEIYRRNGKIEYKDDTQAATGRWELKNGLICMDYDSLKGGCFKIRQHSSNCFEYWLVTVAEPDVKPGEYWLARSEQVKNPPTCPAK